MNDLQHSVCAPPTPKSMLVISTCARIVLQCTLVSIHHRTKFVDDRWMEYYGFIDPATKPSWWEEPVTSVGKPLSNKLSPQDTCAQAVAALRAGGANQLPIVDSGGK